MVTAKGICLTLTKQFGFITVIRYQIFNRINVHVKNQFAWLVQYIHNFEGLNNAALHADYRFSMDNLGINSHTTELSWHQPITAGWQVIPRFRYYRKTALIFILQFFRVRTTVTACIQAIID